MYYKYRMRHDTILNFIFFDFLIILLMFHNFYL